MSYNNSMRLDVVLPKANDLDRVGKPQDAITLLASFLANKRLVKTWSTDLEKAVLKFIELAARLRWRNLEVKFVLFNYRTCTLASNQTAHLLKAMRYLLELAEKQVGNALAVMLDDQDYEDDTPECLAAYAFNTGDMKERRDRPRSFPAVRFFWESHRVVLEVCRINNGKLSEMYHEVARKCFATALQYKRKTEFRRFANILREHATLSRDSSIVDDVSLQLETRFQQLSAASGLQLWAEAYNTIEDIHMSMRSDFSNDAPILLRIYDKLAIFFCENKNFLHYAYAVLQFYTIAESNKEVFEATKAIFKDTIVEGDNDAKSSLLNTTFENVRSMAVVAAISVNPDLDRINAAAYSYSDSQSNSRLLNLLSFNSDSLSRSALFGRIGDMIQGSSADVQGLYDALENSSSPFSLKKVALPVLKSLEEAPVFSRILPVLREVFVLRLLKRLSVVYTSVTIDRFVSLAPSCFSWADLERIIIRSVVSQQVHVRIDHRERVLHFTRDSFEAPSISNQLVALARALSRVVEFAEDSDDVAIMRSTIFEEILERAPQDEEEALQRVRLLDERNAVELQRTRQIEEARLEKEKIEREKIQKELAERLELEKQQKIQEVRQKAEQDRDALQRRQMAEVLSKTLASTDSNLNAKLVKKLANVTKNIENLDKDAIVEASRQFERSKRLEKLKRMNAEYKTLDYTVRALRHVQNADVLASRPEKLAQELADRTAAAERFTTKHKADWEARIAEKHRLSRMQGACEAFRARIQAAQQQ